MGASVGIRPKADGENIVLTDTHRDLVDDVTATTDEFGTVLGEGINEIAATAKSANDAAQDLANRVKKLEDDRLDETNVRRQIERVEQQRTVWWDGKGERPQIPDEGAVVDLRTGQVWGP